MDHSYTTGMFIRRGYCRQVKKIKKKLYGVFISKPKQTLKTGGALKLPGPTGVTLSLNHQLHT